MFHLSPRRESSGGGKSHPTSPKKPAPKSVGRAAGSRLGEGRGGGKKKCLGVLRASRGSQGGEESGTDLSQVFFGGDFPFYAWRQPPKTFPGHGSTGGAQAATTTTTGSRAVTD